MNFIDIITFSLVILFSNLVHASINKNEINIVYVSVVVDYRSDKSLKRGERIVNSLIPKESIGSIHVHYRDIIRTDNACNHTYSDTWHTKTKILSIALSNYLIWSDFLDMFLDYQKSSSSKPYALIFQDDVVCNYNNCWDKIESELRLKCHCSFF